MSIGWDKEFPHVEVTTSQHLCQQWMSTENKSDTSSLEFRVSEVSAVRCCWPGMKCDFHIIMNVAVKGVSSGWTCSRTIVSLITTGPGDTEHHELCKEQVNRRSCYMLIMNRGAIPTKT